MTPEAFEVRIALPLKDYTLLTPRQKVMWSEVLRRHARQLLTHRGFYLGERGAYMFLDGLYRMTPLGQQEPRGLYYQARRAREDDLDMCFVPPVFTINASEYLSAFVGHSGQNVHFLRDFFRPFGVQLIITQMKS